MTAWTWCAAGVLFVTGAATTYGWYLLQVHLNYGRVPEGTVWLLTLMATPFAMLLVAALLFWRDARWQRVVTAIAALTGFVTPQQTASRDVLP